MLKRWSILALGWLVVIVGIILIPVPGPGILVVIAGVVILSLESAHARWLLVRCKTYIRFKWPGMHMPVERFRNEAIRWKKVIFKK